MLNTFKSMWLKRLKVKSLIFFINEMENENAKQNSHCQFFEFTQEL